MCSSWGRDAHGSTSTLLEAPRSTQLQSVERGSFPSGDPRRPHDSLIVFSLWFACRPVPLDSDPSQTLSSSHVQARPV
jgi:hypothetical protein